MEAVPLGLFAEFWKRYRRLRDGAREQFVLQVWLSLDCEAHAAEIMESLGSYEKSRDVARGILMNGDTFLERLSTCGWKATWPAVMAQAAPGSGPQIVEQESKPLPFWTPPPAPQLTPEQDAANEREIDAMLASMSGGRRAS